MKTIARVALILTFFAVSLLGCTSVNEPEQTVSKVMNSIKKGEIDEVVRLMGGEGNIENGLGEELANVIKLSNKTLKYKIIDKTITGDKAVVKVKCSYGAIDPIILETTKQFFNRGMDSELKGIKLTDEQCKQIDKEEMIRAMETVALEEYVVTVDVYCTKIDKKWVVKREDQQAAFRNIITGNLGPALKRSTDLAAEMRDEFMAKALARE